MKEIWKDVVGYEGLYQVSNYGRVKSLNYNRTGQERIMSPRHTKNGYLELLLYKDGKRKQHQTHRLVAKAFIPNPDNKPYLDHINTIRTDNRTDNLRWVTHKENCNNPLTKEQHRISSIGNQSGNKKVFCEGTIYNSATQCALHYNVNRSTMHNWLNGSSKMPTDFQVKGLRYYIEKGND